MAAITRIKISGSTLIEVLIAMIVIMVTFTMSMAVFNNVFFSGLSHKKIEVQNQLNVLSKSVQDAGYVAEEHLLIDSINYELISRPAETKGLSIVRIKASISGKAMGEMTCLYKNKSVE